MDFFDKERPSFQVVENDKLQALLNDIASRSYHEFYKLIDKNLMERKYGIQAGLPRGSKSRQVPPATRTANSRAMDLMNMFQHLKKAPSSSPNSPAPQVDACDIVEGFLSHQFHLMQLFDSFLGADDDKHEDQFRARAMEEPMPLASHTSVRGISHMSRSQTQDGTDHPTTVVASSSAPTPPLLSPLSPPVVNVGFTSASASTSTGDPSPAPSTSVRAVGKRKQKDVEADDETAVAGNGACDGDEEPSSPKGKSKRPRKARS